MFHPKVILRRLDKLADNVRRNIDPVFTFRDYSIAEIDEWNDKLDAIYNPVDQSLLRSLTVEEEAYIRHQILRCKADFPYWLSHFCNVPETPIWMADGTFKNIGDIVVGERVVGWGDIPDAPLDKAGRKAKDTLLVSTVLAISRRKSDLVKVVMASGQTIICTPDHLWERGGTTRKGKYTKVDGSLVKYNWTPAKVGRYLNRIVTPASYDGLSEEHKKLASWLGGIFDGEGTLSATGSNIVLAQTQAFNPDVYKKIMFALSELGFSFTPFSDRIMITGGREAVVKFWNLCKPIKWDARYQQEILGGLFRNQDKIISVQPAGYGEVVSMQTTSGNYVAWGYASKNCFIKGKDPGLIRVTPTHVQELFLKKAAKEEIDALSGKTGDGIMFAVLKARQLGISTISECIITHRINFYGNITGLIASDVEEHTQNLYEMVARIVDHLPWWMQARSIDTKKDYRAKNSLISYHDQDSLIRFSAGKNMQGSVGQEKGSIGTGQTIHLAHVSEFALWPNAEQVYDALLPSIPMSPKAVFILESTAKGRGNQWHDTWIHAKQGIGRMKPVFFPYYTDPRDYRFPAPTEWAPNDHTIAHATQVFNTSHVWLGESMTLSRDQMYWYERTYSEYKQKRILYKFLAEYAADDMSAFQATTLGPFSAELIEDMRAKVVANPILVEIRPRLQY